MNDFNFDLRSGEAEAIDETVIRCAGCPKLRYNPTPLVVFDDGHHYYSHWCDECMEKRSRVIPDPVDEEDWDFLEITDDGKIVTGRDAPVCWGHRGPCDRPSVTTVESLWQSQVPLCETCYNLRQDTNEAEMRK